MRTLNVLLFADDRPGHYTLAEGIVAAMARRRSVAVTRIVIRRPRWLPARLLSALVNRGTDPAFLLRAVYGLSANDLPPAGAVVSAGGDTLAANVAAARLLGVPNVFYGSLRRYREEDFALVLTSYERHRTRPRHLVTPKPNKLDPDTIGPPPTAAGAGQPPRVAGLLVGGEAGTVHFAGADWRRLTGFLRAQSRAHATRWIVATSPRTPAPYADELTRLAAEPDGPIERLIDFRKAGPGQLAAFFGAVDTVAVTADSSSMLSEAIWVRRPVVALAPADFRLTPDELDYRRFLEASGWSTVVAIAGLTPETFVAALARVTPLQANPLDRLADELAARLPGLLVDPPR